MRVSSKTQQLGSESRTGLPNYFLRYDPTIIAGMNSKDVARSEHARRRQPRIVPHQLLRPEPADDACSRVEPHPGEGNLLEHCGSRVGYVGTHGTRLDQFYTSNDPANSMCGSSRRGCRCRPASTRVSAPELRSNRFTANIEEFQKTGWSNFNGVSLELQRRFAKGYGFQFFYTMSNALRCGRQRRGAAISATTNLYLPGAVPADLQERNRFLFYRRDTEVPQHRLRLELDRRPPVRAREALGGRTRTDLWIA